MRSSPSRYSLFVVILFGFAALGCKKNKDKSVDNPATPADSAVNYKITSWNKYAGTVTYFQSSNGKFKEEWYFGDGVSLSLPQGSGAVLVGPIGHFYKAPGIYTVTLVVNDDTAHKTTQTDTIAANYSFYYTGLPVVGDTIYFHFRAFLPAGVSYLWTFGDGTTSNDSIPYHIYHSEGNFVVKLIINGNPASLNVREQISIYKDPVYTQEMTNVRLWHTANHVYRIYDSASYSVYSTLPDTSFAIKYVNKIVLSFAHTDFTFNPALSSGDAIVFSSEPATIHELSTIYYNHLKDSAVIFLHQVSQDAPGTPPMTEDVTWHSP